MHALAQRMRAAALVTTGVPVAAYPGVMVRIVLTGYFLLQI
jgi:hypothetical protein